MLISVSYKELKMINYPDISRQVRLPMSGASIQEVDAKKVLYLRFFGHGFDSRQLHWTWNHTVHGMDDPRGLADINQLHEAKRSIK